VVGWHGDWATVGEVDLQFSGALDEFFLTLLALAHGRPLAGLGQHSPATGPTCPEWKTQQKILWAEVLEESGRGKFRFKIRNLPAARRY